MEGPPRAVSFQQFSGVRDSRAQWIAFSPYAYLPEGGNTIVWNSGYSWWGEGIEGIRQCLRFADSLNLKVMLKPQIWIGRGSYTGDLTYANEADWVALEQSYRSYIMEFAALADSLPVDLMCIGTELDRFAAQRPDYWLKLINDVKTQYRLKLTYSANWDSHQKIPFWDHLDYIGVSAYFPLTGELAPSLDQLKSGWEPHLINLKAASEKWSKSILFTEYGYRSRGSAASEPWAYGSGEGNQRIQANCYQSLYESVWDQPWFAGGFMWKWEVLPYKSAGHREVSYSPQGKLALKVMQDHYGKRE